MSSPLLPVRICSVTTPVSNVWPDDRRRRRWPLLWYRNIESRVLKMPSTGRPRAHCCSRDNRVIVSSPASGNATTSRRVREHDESLRDPHVHHARHGNAYRSFVVVARASHVVVGSSGRASLWRRTARPAAVSARFSRSRSCAPPP